MIIKYIQQDILSYHEKHHNRRMYKSERNAKYVAVNPTKKNLIYYIHCLLPIKSIYNKNIV